MATLKVNSASLTSIANALRTAGNTADELTFPAGFVSAIESLSGSTGDVQMAVGTQTLSSAASLTVENLPFTPNRAVLLLIRRSTTKGVLVNAVAPGPIDTDMTAALPEAARQRQNARIPMGRFGRPEEVAAAVAFLASDDAAYITGETLCVDGGLN